MVNPRSRESLQNCGVYRPAPHESQHQQPLFVLVIKQHNPRARIRIMREHLEAYKVLFFLFSVTLIELCRFAYYFAEKYSFPEANVYNVDETSKRTEAGRR
jgi:hypothetical protein